VLTGISDQMGDSTFVKSVNQHLSKLSEELDKLLLRFADAKYKDWRSKTIFLMNNYDLVLTVMTEKSLSSVDSQQFQKLLDTKTTDYASDEINKSFGRLIAFVKTYEQAEANNEEKINAREEEVESLLKEFQSSWKIELEKINNNIMKQFSNFKRGMAVFEKIMEQLLDSYTKLVKIIKKYFKNLRTSKFFTPETEITYEMKRLFVRFD